MLNWLASHDGEDDAMAAPSTCPPGTEHVSGSGSGSRRIFGDITTNRLWTFRVLMHEDLAPSEHLAVVGNCEALGNWKPAAAALMTQEDNVWSVEVYIPRHCATEYRYMVCAVEPSSEQPLVRRWETQFQARAIEELDEQPPKEQLDIFGSVNGQEKVDRGWLTRETIVQLKFFYAPFTFKQRMKRRHVQVKVTPMNLRIPSAGCEPSCGSAGPVSPPEDSLSNDTHDTRDNGGDSSTAFAFSEVVTLSADECEIRAQEQFGTDCGPSDLVIFHITVGDLENTAYLIDLYTYSSRVAKEDGPPHHLGYHYVLPNLFKRSEGNLEIPITCAKGHRPLGMMRLGYLIVRPSALSAHMDMSVSYARYWNNKWTGLDVGHRGSGTSFKAKDAVIRENTITSLKNAAEHGADMVEFDVQLSKDLVPVVYHDFMIYVSLKSKCSMQEHDFLSLPMRELTLEQLKKLKVYHTAEGLSRETRSFHNDDMLEHQPFPQLSDVLDALDVHVGFNIEIKWSQRLQDGRMEEEFEHVVDRNLYIDCILDVVLRKGGNRRIVLSCFDPDICTMLRFKQNRYPVMFLTLGRTTKYKQYMDPRGNSMELAVWHAVAMQLLGIVAHTEDLLRDPSQVNLAKERGLVLFCWGDDNNSQDTIKLLKGLGLHAIIYDKMDVLTTKEVKQSVFHLQAKDSQKEMLKLQALEMGHVWHTSANGNEEQHA
ncbi:glycerophosphocholine phosphodiesterase GPCPD1 [Drosophila guanche]|uniref:Blast:Glycerophosphocholine phosphodiesterase GPCPD1 n=1 Tax=Drosophila guanche TaxID=7266 RepID=A0A3B0JZG3_DROGU|nr:glycerophosphocholine phosphodiesterase GPCPD1 [Drosophila guanche]XP_034126369.1 glycerophosphocholine phosphodiesterase GPCPD1 [Drosophila guanche]XP_034126370.1 glycerophosphocholine phosphodiesterase GPCPD1 [Drosophila guanche]XP_034126371.1 glycerophosphocholine phosphodiesterase GPCPD1 [Drosophila guanche]SPP79069.1 blast:Glycerophosphocholine phosphodiesterase GPCPD1 [Drosophila guanche]